MFVIVNIWCIDESTGASFNINRPFVNFHEGDLRALSKIAKDTAQLSINIAPPSINPSKFHLNATSINLMKYQDKKGDWGAVVQLDETACPKSVWGYDDYNRFSKFCPVPEPPVS